MKNRNLDLKIVVSIMSYISLKVLLDNTAKFMTPAQDSKQATPAKGAIGFELTSPGWLAGWLAG